MCRRKGVFKADSNIIFFGAAASFLIFFGGNLTDAFFAGITGLIIAFPWYGKISFPLFSINLIDAFVTSIASFLPSVLSINIQNDKIIIGAIMILVPGLTVVNAIRDMMSLDLLAGLIELITAVMSVLAIALGVAGGLLIFSEL
ncbi:MAG: threonine/serine exporter family protein [Clostridiales bacterium]|nr:threonine/serine exporter family protein [Clostridiales bacterium]